MNMNKILNNKVILAVIFLLCLMAYFSLFHGKNNKNLKNFEIRRVLNSTENPVKNDEKKEIIDYSKDKLICMVLASEKTIESRVVAVVKSWAHRCNKTVVVCNCKNVTYNKTENRELMAKMEILELPIVEDYNKMAEKVLMCMKVVFEKYGNEYNWFLMSDDDTFIFTRNLFNFIRSKNTNQPLTYGYNLKQEVPTGYQSGGAGILFTHQTAKRIYNRIKEGGCNYKMGYGDIALGYCINEVGVKMGNSLDSKGRERFHPFEPKWHYFNQMPNWVFGYSQNGVKIGDDCCSDETISYHYVTADQMLTLAYFNKYN